MAEDRQTRRFEDDLSTMLEAGGVGGQGQADDLVHRGMLETAARLASADFSAESRVRESLRREVVQRSAAGGRMRPFAWLGRIWGAGSLLLAPATVVLAMLVVMIAWPGAVAAAADGIERFVRQLVLDENTSVRQATDDDRHELSEFGEDAAIFEEGGAAIWVARTTVRERGTVELPLIDLRETKTYADVESAQADLDFRLLQPAELPDGYSLVRIRVTPTGWALSHYRGPGGLLILAHVPQGSPGGTDAETGFGTTVEVLTDDPIEQVSVNGIPAAWIEGQTLSWVDEGISYTLGGGQLTLADALRVAETLR